MSQVSPKLSKRHSSITPQKACSLTDASESPMCFSKYVNSIDAQRNRIKRESTSPRSDWLLLVPLLIASFSVSINSTMQYALIGTTAICVIWFLIIHANQLNSANRGLSMITLLFLLPWVTSFTFGLIGTIVGSDYPIIGEMSPYGRMFNAIMLSGYLLCASVCYERSPRVIARMPMFYFIGCVVLLLFAIWQGLDIYTNLAVSFPFVTRSNMHSAGDLSLSVTSRLTGFAAEPSYICPFLADGFLLSFIVFQTKWHRYISAALFLVITFLTYSPSGYITIFSVALIYLIWRFSRSSDKTAYLVIVLALFAIFYAFRETDAMKYFLLRAEGYEDSGRFKAIIGPLEYMFSNANVINILFGYGVKSMDAFVAMNYDFFIFGTTNTLIVDLLFETGIFGLSCYLVILIYLFKLSCKQVANSPLALLLFADLFVSSLYRADYATLRFPVLLILVYALSQRSTIAIAR